MKTLLVSPEYIRKNSNISDNVNGKVLSNAIRDVQQDELQEILGQLLLETLDDLVYNEEIDNEENQIYKELLDKIRTFVMYRVIAELCVMLNLKIDNAGIISTKDENMDYASFDETFKLKEYYDTKASHWAYLLQNWLLENRSQIPELTECQCYKIHSVLYSAGSPNIFLGGARGKGWYRGFPYRFQRGNNWPSK